VSEVTVGEHRYRIDKLDAMKQFHVARRLVPVLAAFTKIGDNFQQAKAGGVQNVGVAAMLPIAEAISHMSDVDSEYIVNTCMAAVFKFDSERWHPMMIQGAFVYQNTTMADLVKLTSEVIMDNLGDFFSGLQTT
jgi:hypothetical protein